MVNSIEKREVGRPTKITEVVLKKLEDAFLDGCNDITACLRAGISHQTLYSYQEKYPAFVERKQMLKTNPVSIAKKQLLKHLKKGEDTKLLTWQIEQAEGKATQKIDMQVASYTVIRKTYDDEIA